MNAKIGKAPWHTGMPKNWNKRKAMIIGVDVFHNIGENLESCVGFSASLDPNLSRYFTKVVM